MTRAKIKIGFVFDDSLDRNDGVQQYIKVVANYLHRQGHEIHYFVGETKDAGGFPGKVHSLSKNITVSGNQNRLSIPRPASNEQIRLLLQTIKPDILHIQMPFSPFLGAKVINQAADATAIVATFHIVGERIVERYGSQGLRLVTNKATNRIDQFLSVSQPAAEYARQYYRVDSDVLPNVVELDHFRSADAKPHSRPTILFLGRLVERKGADLLLDAIVCEHDRLKGLDTRVLIAGGGPMRAKLETMVREHNLGELVEFLGFIDEADKPSLIASSDLAVFPSTGGESFGIVLIEAMATGGPVVLAGNNQGYSSVVGAQSEMIVDPTDSIGMGSQIVKLLTNTRLRDQLKSWQNVRVKDFDIETVGPELEKIYHKTIKARANHDG